MKRIILFAAIFLMLFSAGGIAGNRIIIMATEPITSPVYDLPIGFENDVPIAGFTNAFVLSVAGDITASFIEFGMYIDTLSRDGQIPMK